MDREIGEGGGRHSGDKVVLCPVLTPAAVKKTVMSVVDTGVRRRSLFTEMSDRGFVGVVACPDFTISTRRFLEWKAYGFTSARTDGISV